MYLSLGEVAESFGVSEDIVVSWVREEGMPHTPDRDRLLFKRDDVVTWAESRGLAAQVGFLARGLGSSGLSLSALLRAGGISREVAPDRIAAEIGRAVSGLPEVSPAVADLLVRRVEMPDGLVWTTVGGGLALLHLSTRVSLGRRGGLVALLLLSEPIVPPEPPSDGAEIRGLLFFIAPTPRVHLDLLARLSQLLREGGVAKAVGAAASDDEIHRMVASSDTAAREARKGGDQ